MNKAIKRTAAALLAAVQLAALLPLQAFAQTAHLPNSGRNVTYMGRKLYTGQVHSHTSLSDGVELPEDAYEHVRETTTLDFFGVTDHDVLLDIRNGDDYLTDVKDALSDDWRFLHETADRYNEDGEFVTIAGEEITWYDQSGHMNLYNTAWKLTAFSKNRWDGMGGGDVKYDLPTFYARLAQDPEAIAQFNHPNPTGKGDFWTFSHYTKEADDQLELFEYKVASYLPTFQNCLDAGWHVSPTWNGDEHSATWGDRAPRTGIWTNSKTREGLYKAFRERSTYSTLDANFELIFSANDAFMGSILPGDTTEFEMYAKLYDPDTEDRIDNVTIYTNQREIVKQWNDVGSNLLEINETFDCADGDYFFIVVNEEDGEQIVSAPMWIGETTRGTNFAPEITVNGTVPETVEINQTVTIPSATAMDDTDGAREVTVDVINSEGIVEVVDGTFTPDSYDDYFIRYRAEDSTGSIRVELLRTTVDRSDMQADAIFGQFAPVASVGETADEVGVNVVTDPALTTAYLQVVPAQEEGWEDAQTILSEESSMQLEVASELDAPGYEDPITDKPLRSHEFDLTGLTPGTTYKYRLGVSADGGWTSKEYTFTTAQPDGETSLYIMGDLQVPGTEQSDYDLFNDMLATLKEKEPDASVMVQLGDFVDNAAKYEYWKSLSDYVLEDLGMLTSTMTGNHETYDDLNLAHSHTDSPYSGSSTFNKMYNLPENGSDIGESNYSYDIGEMHIAVLNSTTALDEQLKWLEQDMRATDKPWRIVMGHFPYFGSRHSTDSGMAEQREKVAKACQQLGVSLYIGGHDHVYKRTTIRDGVATNDPEDMNQGTTFVTSGSAGPKFYDNEEFWWDHVVYDEDVQTGMVLSADQDSLTLTTYTTEGEVVDSFTLGHAQGLFELSSTDIQDKQWNGVGFLATEDAREDLTVIAAKYTEDESELLDFRAVDVTLERKGKEQYVSFATPITFDSSNVLKVMIWSGLDTAQPVLYAQTLRKGMKGFGTAEQPYEIYTWDDFINFTYEPSAHFRLMNDLELDGMVRTQLSNFTGVFDGGGHTISGFQADPSKGSGLFATNDGVIRNLTVVGAVESDTSTAGILCDLNRGTIENCYVSGTIAAPSRVGGIAGDSYGIIRDCYSTADVHSLGTEAGGVVGLGMEGSVTERCYSTGTVTADSKNAGGVVGYGYTGTTVRNCIALNDRVNGNSYSNRVVGRIKSGHTPVLENNYGSVKVMVTAEQQGVASTTTEKGATATLAQIEDQTFYRDTLGWDFETVWQWDENGQRPVLQMLPEVIVPGEEEQKPSLPQDENGYYEIASAADLAVLSQFPEENYVLTADITLTAPMSPLCTELQFMGVLDGAGHKIIGYTSTEGGLIHMNAGTIQNLGMEGANIQAPNASNIGILCNTNGGTIESCYTTGSIAGQATTGGVVGYLNGTIRDCYSTARVSSTDRQAGGVVGISGRGSTTERCYATGAVSADANAGGITGYTYATTNVSGNFALNASVTAPTQYGHRVAARTLGSEIANIGINFAWADMPVSQTEKSDTRFASLMGEGKTREEMRSVDTFKTGLGWDFETVWQWDETAQRPVLRGCTEKTGEKPALTQDENGYYQISSAGDLAQISKFPEENYILTKDIDLAGETVEQLCQATPFSGVLDGAGHRLLNFTSETGGLFKENAGTIRRLGIVQAVVTAEYDQAGILCDVSNGLIEECYTTGSIAGASTQGGIVGYLNGTLSNCYSTADVTVNAGKYAGGLVGISARYSNSVIENCYATGAVTVVSNQSAGGITGYTYEDSTVKNCFALNASITATSYAHRIAARTRGNEVAVLENNFALADMPVNTTAEDEDRTDGWMGISKTAEETQQQETFAEGLGWDFDSVWQWDPTAQRPVLRNCTEETSAKPSLSQDDNGYYEITSAADLAVISQFPAENYVLTTDLDLAEEAVEQLCQATPFSGTFDGAGHRLLNFTSETGGLFKKNTGIIRRLGLVDAEVTAAYDKAGILCDVSDGLIEECYTTGSITGASTQGGIVGYLNGTLSNCYSTANVTVNAGKYAGGLVGISGQGVKSVIEDCYATGAVTVVDNQSAGGITGYTYKDSTVRNCFALNASITATSYAHRIAARTLSSQVATLENNFALADMPVNAPAEEEDRTPGWMGTEKTADEAHSQETFSQGLGWDFDSVWAWDDSAGCPVLKCFA